MKTFFSILFAVAAFVIATYNNEYMLSRLTQLSEQTKLASKNFFNFKSSRTMATNGTTTFRGLPIIPDEPLTTTAPRKIHKAVHAIEQAEGAGARVRRSIGTPQLRNFSPFLMLDHFDNPSGGAGFPDHPHRGQETITYMLSGAFEHEDFLGNSGTLEPGDL
jgi:hypothetical protein